MERVVSALAVPDDRLARLELVDRDDLPHVLVQLGRNTIEKLKSQLTFQLRFLVLCISKKLN